MQPDPWLSIFEPFKYNPSVLELTEACDAPAATLGHVEGLFVGFVGGWAWKGTSRRASFSLKTPDRKDVGVDEHVVDFSSKPMHVDFRGGNKRSE